MGNKQSTQQVETKEEPISPEISQKLFFWVLCTNTPEEFYTIYVKKLLPRISIERADEIFHRYKEIILAIENFTSIAENGKLYQEIPSATEILNTVLDNHVIPATVINRILSACAIAEINREKIPKICQEKCSFDEILRIYYLVEENILRRKEREKIRKMFMIEKYLPKPQVYTPLKCTLSENEPLTEKDAIEYILASFAGIDGLERWWESIGKIIDKVGSPSVLSVIICQTQVVDNARVFKIIQKDKYPDISIKERLKTMYLEILDEKNTYISSELKSYAMIGLGILLYGNSPETEDVADSVKLLEKSCQEGNGYAMYFLGDILYTLYGDLSLICDSIQAGCPIALEKSYPLGSVYPYLTEVAYRPGNSGYVQAKTEFEKIKQNTV